MFQTQFCGAHNSCVAHPLLPKVKTSVFKLESNGQGPSRCRCAHATLTFTLTFLRTRHKPHAPAAFRTHLSYECGHLQDFDYAREEVSQRQDIFRRWVAREYSHRLKFKPEITIFWDVTPCIWMKVHLRFR
jgi:hypothetical protein